MTLNSIPDAQQVTQLLQSYLELFTRYSDEIFGTHQQDRLDELRTQLQRKEPLVTRYVLQIVGEGSVVTGSFGIRQQIAYRNLLSISIMGENNELAFNFADYKAPVIAMLNQALGNINAGLWPLQEPNPVIIIKDEELKKRCFDLLKAPGYFDRVIREATTVLEDRIRNKVPRVILSKLIPLSQEQQGEKLVNILFSPKRPILVVSSDEHERLEFHKILLGVFSYLRNPHHHKLDDRTDWSWAWSTTGLIDRLLFEVDNCELSEHINI